MVAASRESSKEHLMRLLARVESLPALPSSVQELCRLTEDVNVGIQKVDQVISSDPAITSKLLRVANSAFYGLSQRVTTVSQAIVVLGFQGVKNLALGLAVFGFRGNITCDMPVDREELWRHALATACTARLLATHLHINIPEEAFTGGLLHDIGQVLLMEYTPEEYAKVLTDTLNGACLLHERERQLFGIEHAELGARICEHWKIPSVLGKAVAEHGRYVESAKPASMDAERISFAVQAANALSRLAQIGSDGNSLVQLDLMRLRQAHGISFEQIRQIVLRVPEDVARMESLFDLGHSSPEEDRMVQMSVGICVSDEKSREMIALALLGIGCVPIPEIDPDAISAPQVVIHDGAVSDDILQKLRSRKTRLMNFDKWTVAHSVKGTGAFNTTAFVDWFKAIQSVKGNT